MRWHWTFEFRSLNCTGVEDLLEGTLSEGILHDEFAVRSSFGRKKPVSRRDGGDTLCRNCLREMGWREVRLTSVTLNDV